MSWGMTDYNLLMEIRDALKDIAKELVRINVNLVEELAKINVNLIDINRT